MRSKETQKTSNVDKYIISIGNSVTGEKDWSQYFGDYKNNVFFRYKLYPHRGDISITYTIYSIAKIRDVMLINELSLVYGTANEIADYMMNQHPSVPEYFVADFLKKAIVAQRENSLRLILD